VTFAFDGDPSVSRRQCPACGNQHESGTGFVLKNDTAYAVYYVDWYPHTDEAYVDVVLGPWLEPEYPDQVTFGCRLGHVDGQDGPAASLVTAGGTRPDHPMFGRKLNRDGALAHPRLSRFWRVIDWLIVNDPTLHENIYHMDGEE